jgi:hypothetical protein
MLRLYQRISPVLRLCIVFCNMVIFYGEELLAPCPTPKLEGHPLSAVRDCLFNVFAATLHIRRPFLHPQPEDAPCHGDRDQLIIGFRHIMLFTVHIKLLCAHLHCWCNSVTVMASDRQLKCTQIVLRCNRTMFVGWSSLDVTGRAVESWE